MSTSQSPKPNAENSNAPKVVRRQLGDAADALISGVFLVAILLSIFATWAIGMATLPSVEEAHASFIYAQEANAQFSLYRGLLHFGYSTIFVSAMLLISMRLFRRKHGRGLRARWYWTLIALVLFGAWSFYSAILPMDQAAWHGTLARKGVIEATPLIGEAASQWLFPNGTITQATLSHFSLMAVGVLPALMLIVSLALWKARTKARSTLHGVGMLLGLGAIGLGAWVFPESVLMGIAPRPEFSDVRPEWFFLPLSLGLKESSGSASMMDIIALSPAILIGLLAILPYVSGSWHWHLDRALCGASLIAFGLLLGLGLADDLSQDEGYFAKPDLEALMNEMGKVNKSVGNQGSLFSDQAYAAIPDLIVMADQSITIAHEQERSDEWLKYSREMREAALRVWKSNPQDLEINFESLRVTCDSCHDAYDEVIEVRYFDDFVKVSKGKETIKENQDTPSPKVFTGYSAEALADLKPLAPAPTDFSASKAFDKYMKQLHKLTKRVMQEEPIDVLQDLVDLNELLGVMTLDDDALRVWAIEDEMLIEDDTLEMWRERVIESMQGVEKSKNATTLNEWIEGAKALRSGCVGCHDDFDFGDGEIEITPLRAR